MVFFTVRSHVFEARIEVENYGNIRMITVKSNSTGEKKIEIHPNLNFNLRTQTSFITNSCIVIEGQSHRVCSYSKELRKQKQTKYIIYCTFELPITRPVPCGITGCEFAQSCVQGHVPQILLLIQQ